MLHTRAPVAREYRLKNTSSRASRPHPGLFPKPATYMSATRVWNKVRHPDGGQIIAGGVVGDIVPSYGHRMAEDGPAAKGCIGDGMHLRRAARFGSTSQTPDEEDISLSRIYVRRIPSWIFGASTLTGLYLHTAQRV